MLHFNWLNKKIFYNEYIRSNSYFPGCSLDHNNAFQDGKIKSNSMEESILNKTFNKDSLFSKDLTEIKVDDYLADASIPRNVLQESKDLFFKCSWHLNKDGKMVDVKDGKPFPTLELILSVSDLQKIGLHLQQNLAQIGISLNVRILDTATYQERLQNRDYDFVYEIIPQSLTPGNEQRDYFGSQNADLKGSKNFAGIKDKDVDKIIENIVAAQTYEDQIAFTRVLDYILCSGYYIILDWYKKSTNVAYWDKIKMPEKFPPYTNVDIFSWWIDEKSVDTQHIQFTPNEEIKWYKIILDKIFGSKK
jgi:microcin C transport system substrate-binding protein